MKNASESTYTMFAVLLGSSSGPFSSSSKPLLTLKKASESTYTMLALRLCTSHSLTASPLPNLHGGEGRSAGN